MNFVTGRGHHRRYLEARAAFLEFFSSVHAVRPPKNHNEVLAGNSGPQALKGSGALRSLRSVILDPRDLTDWKELRNLKLR